MRIGDLAALSSVSVEALRYYEQRGLLRPFGRRNSGYREYRSDSVRLVRFIKRAQSLGFTLAEVEELVQLRERAWSGDGPRPLREAAVAKMEDMDRRMRELGRLRAALAELVAACDVACTAEPCDAPRDTATDACCTSSATSTGAQLPCPLIEAFDAESLDPTDVQDLVLTAPPADVRRAEARRAGRRADTPPNRRRN